MASELCPRCRQVRNARVTVSRRKVRTPDGKSKEIKTNSFHCEACGAFVRSEDMEESETSEEQGEPGEGGAADQKRRQYPPQVCY